MNVVLIGIYYPAAILRYFEAALRRRDDVTLWTVGPYTGSWMPWNGGMELEGKYESPNLEIDTTIYWLIENIEMFLPWRADLWLQINSTWYLPGKPQYGINAIVGVDPHSQDYTQAQSCADTFFSMHYPAANYLPYAYDPTIHTPQYLQLTITEIAAPDNPKFDAMLIGSEFGGRQELMNYLREQGFRVYHKRGFTPKQMVEKYADTKVAVNLSVSGELPARIFEYAAMGVPILTGPCRGIGLFFDEDVHYRKFTTHEEAAAKLEEMLRQPEATRKMAEAARLKGLPETYDARVQTILEAVANA